MSDYIDGGMDTRHRARIARHAGYCPECGPMLRALTFLVGELSALGRLQGEETVVPGVLARVHAEHRFQRS
ncbi:MAG: hypothetical protein NVSMB25_12350 [Thermoleophilaceae bacterium]